MSETKTDPKIWATVTIVVSTIACLGTILSALLGALPEFMKIRATQTAEHLPSSAPYFSDTSTPIVIPAITNVWTSTPEITLTPTAYFYYEKAETCYQNKDFDCAISYYTQAISLKPDYANAYFKRGDTYDEIEKYELAIIDYAKAIELKYEPLDKVYRYRGITQFKKGEYELAILDFDVSINIKPTENAYYMRAQSYLYLQNYEMTISDVSEFLKTNPSSAYAYNLRGYAYEMSGDDEKAIADYRMVVTLNNNNTAKEYAVSRLISMGILLP